MWVRNLTLLRKVEVDHFISKRTHTYIVLRFYVKVWWLSHLYGCSEPNMDDHWTPPRDPTLIDWFVYFCLKHYFGPLHLCLVSYWSLIKKSAFKSFNLIKWYHISHLLIFIYFMLATLGCVYVADESTSSSSRLCLSRLGFIWTYFSRISSIKIRDFETHLLPHQIYNVKWLRFIIFFYEIVEKCC